METQHYVNNSLRLKIALTLCINICMFYKYLYKYFKYLYFHVHIKNIRSLIKCTEKGEDLLYCQTKVLQAPGLEFTKGLKFRQFFCLDKS